MSSYFDVLSKAGILQKAHCDWCNSPGEFYQVEGEIVCGDCLIDTVYDEYEEGLTLEERND
jgi:uncharacterized protein YuzB (UPF0349 family)